MIKGISRMLLVPHLRITLVCCVFLFATQTLARANDLPIVSGYAGSWSLAPGQPSPFHLSGMPNENALLSIYDVHYKPIASIAAPIRHQQKAEDNLQPWVDGMGYEVQMLDLPHLHSGIYYLDGPELTRSRIPFLINNHTEVTDVVVVYPTNTVNAYSKTEGINLYSKVDGVQPEAVSFLRPQDVGEPKMYYTRGLDRLLLRSDDYTYKYIADSDLESFDSIAGAKLVIVPGHSEYWTEPARRNFDRFVTEGGAALALTGNTMFRKVGYDDPENPTQLTFHPRRQFTSPSLEYPTWESIGVDFVHGGNGSGYQGMRERLINPHDGWKILSTPSYLSENGLEVGDVIHAPAAEYDGVPYTECDPETGPVVDTELMGFHKIEVVAFDNTSYGGMRPTCGSWVDFRKTATSGRQITVGAFTAALFGGRSGFLQNSIASDMIDLLLIDQADFDRDEELSVLDIDQLSHAIRSESPSTMYDINSDGFVDHHDRDEWITDYAKTVPGDANVDGRVDFTDYLQFASNFASHEAVWSDGDFDSNGTVDFADFLILSGAFQSLAGKAQQTTATSVPEPNATRLGLAAVLLLSRCRRRRASQAHAL